MKAKAKKDGPINKGTCGLCRCYFDEDVYFLDGFIVCGDCRYWVRTGSWPRVVHPMIAIRNRSKHVIRKKVGSGNGYDGSTHTQGRFLPTNVVSVKHALLLMEMENEGKS